MATPRRALLTEAEFPPLPPKAMDKAERAAFAMTINKAQGQTLQRVGIYLDTPCFSHGQLYVAASRVGKRDRLRFALKADTPATSTHETT